MRKTIKRYCDRKCPQDIARMIEREAGADEQATKKRFFSTKKHQEGINLYCNTLNLKGFHTNYSLMQKNLQDRTLEYIFSAML